MSNPRSFFGGSSARDGRVRRLQAKSWKELVERYINVPVAFPMTHAEFMANPERDSIKDGPWLSAVTYPYDEGRRGNEFAEKLCLLTIDIDGGEDAKAFAASPSSVLEHLWPLNVAVYTTAKSTPDAPRLRIIVDVADCPPELLPRFITLIVKRLGLPPDFKGITESRILSQPAFRPAQWSNEPFTAVLATRTDGVALTEADLPDEDEEVEELLGPRTFACKPGLLDDSLGLAFLPVAGLSVDDLREALEAIDPDCDYHTWTAVCCSLRHQFTVEEDAAAAFDLFNLWSANGSKYRGEKATYAKWSSFQPYARSGAPITVRSLLKTALDTGWTGGKLAVKLKDDIASWIDACDDADVLMAEGPKKLANMPLQSEVVLDNLVCALQSRIKDITNNRIEKRSILKEVARERKRTKADKSEQNGNMPGWLRPICFIATKNVYHNFGTGVAICPAAFDTVYSVELMPKDGAEVPANGRPIMLPTAYATNVIKIPRVDEALYYPLHSGEDPFFELDGRLYLNTYNPLSVPVPDPENSDAAGALFTRHVETVVGKGEHSERVLDYLSLQIKFPGVKIPWAPLIQSAEGVGKGFIGRVMMAVMGPPNVKVVMPGTLTQTWNDWWGDCAFIVLDEIHIPGEHRERVMNSLKQLITDPIITINQRHVSANCRAHNWINCIGFTNFHDATHMKDSDRRWYILCSPLQTKAHVLALTDSGHFNRVEILANEWAPALRHWMLKRKISPDFPHHGPAPLTKWRQAVIEESKNPVQQKVEDMLRGTDPAIQPDIVAVDAVVAALPRHLTSQGHRITHYLTLLGFENAMQRADLNGGQSPVWVNNDQWDDGLGSPAEELTRRIAARGDLSL